MLWRSIDGCGIADSTVGLAAKPTEDRARGAPALADFTEEFNVVAGARESLPRESLLFRCIP